MREEEDERERMSVTVFRDKPFGNEDVLLERMKHLSTKTLI